MPGPQFPLTLSGKWNVTQGVNVEKRGSKRQETYKLISANVELTGSWKMKKGERRFAARSLISTRPEKNLYDRPFPIYRLRENKVLGVGAC